MPPRAPALSAVQVSRLREPGFHRVGTIAGLALQITPSGVRTWVLRYEFAGRRRDMGLGGYPEVPLAKAWEKAREARDKLRSGFDPIDERRAARSALKAAQATALTFTQAARDYIAAHSSGWKNAKHRAQWAATLAEYAYPVIGKLPARDIEVALLVRVLEPIWAAKTETASRLRARIERILDWATVCGYRSGSIRVNSPRQYSISRGFTLQPPFNPRGDGDELHPFCAIPRKLSGQSCGQVRVNAYERIARRRSTPERRTKSLRLAGLGTS